MRELLMLVSAVRDANKIDMVEQKTLRTQLELPMLRL